MNRVLKKALLILFLMMLCIMIMEITSNADGSCTVSVSASTVEPGKKFTVSISPGSLEGFDGTITVSNATPGSASVAYYKQMSENKTSAEFTANAAGTCEITITLNEAKSETEESTETYTRSVTVKAPEPPPSKTLSSIAISSAPSKTTYTEGEKFDKAGMSVTAKYSDGSEKGVTEYSCSPASELKTSDTTITVSYSEGGVTKTATQGIKVNAKANTNTNTNTNNTVPKNTVANNTVEPTVVNPEFKAVNEKVYAVNSCNVRSSCSTATNNNKIGSLEKDELVIRTGVSSEWSRIVFNGKVAYVATKLLTTTPPDEEENTVEENTVENEISNELDTLKSEVGILPEVGNNVSVQLFFVTTMISISIISSFIYIKIKEN